MTAFLHSGGKNSHDRLSGRPHLSTLLQWDLNCQDTNFEGHIPIIHTVWIVGILTGLWTVPDFFQTSPIWKEGFTLIEKKIVLLPASEMHQLFLRIPRHDSTSSVSSWASVLIHFSEVHETSLCHTGLWETFILPPLLFFDFQRAHHLWVPKWMLSLIQGREEESHYPSPREKTDLVPIQWDKRIWIVCLS